VLKYREKRLQNVYHIRIYIHSSIANLVKLGKYQLRNLRSPLRFSLVGRSEDPNLPTSDPLRKSSILREDKNFQHRMVRVLYFILRQLCAIKNV